MKPYILLFRGINVGGRNSLPMEALRTLLESCGYARVKTYIQSGNVVLAANQPPGDDICVLIEEQFGFKPELIVLDKTQFDGAVAANPYESSDGKRIHFYFLAKPAAPNFEKLASLLAESEKFELKGDVFYLFAPEGIGRSKLVANLERCMGVNATGRNLNSIRKIQEMLAE